MTARARGFIEAWHPRAESWELLSSVSTFSMNMSSNCP